MKMYDPVFESIGEKIITGEFIDALRERNLSLPPGAKMYNYIPQVGFQEEVLLCEADITVLGGNRGGGKTFVLLLSTLYNYYQSRAASHGFRREEDDIKRGLWELAKTIFENEAAFTEGNFTVTFPTGSKIVFEQLADEKKVDQRFRGVEIPQMIIDELPQYSFETVLTLLSSNRNSLGIKNKFYASCNPVGAKHWLYRFLSWYIDEETKTIRPERNGVIRYFFKYGESEADIAWGCSKEEVYEKAKPYIDALYDESLVATGGNKFDIITSVRFIEGVYAQNLIFRKNDKQYQAKIASQGAKAFRDIRGIWEDNDEGTESLLSPRMMDAYFANTEQRGERRTAVADVALSRDSFVLGAFDGDHLYDVESFTKVGSKTAEKLVRKFLEKHHIREENFAFDADGVGQYLKEPFKKAFPFNNNSSSSDGKVWANLKSECAEKWTEKVKEGACSIDSELLKRKFGEKTLKEHLIDERRVLVRKATNNGKFQLISKAEMKKILGGRRSPDYIDMLFMHEVFTVFKKTRKRKGLWMLG